MAAWVMAIVTPVVAMAEWVVYRKSGNVQG